MSQAVGHRGAGTPLAVGVMVATTLTMALGDALVKYVSSDFSLWQIYVLRSLIAIPLILALLASVRPSRIMPRSIGWTVLRSLLLMAMWIAFYAALPILSLSVVAASYYTGPLFITLFSALLIGEPVGLKRWLAIFIGFAGVLVILRPGTEAFSYVTLLPVVSAVFYALAAIVTRAKCADERPLVLSLVLNLSFATVGAIASTTLLLWSSAPDATEYRFLLGRWTEMGVREWEIIALLAALIVAISSGVAKAYQSGPPPIIATFDYTYLVFAALWSFVIFAEIPDAATTIGMTLIAGAGVIAVFGPGSTRARAL